VLGKYALKAKRYGKHFNAVFFRRELPMLDDAIERSQEIYGPLGAQWQDQKKTWRFPWGGRLRFRPLESVKDAEKYQGQNLTDACIEEVGQYPDSRPIDRLNGVLRSAHGVPTQLMLTGNPGGPGQGWIKQRYIDPAPLGMKVLRRKLPNGKEHRFVYIPSRVEHNRELMRSDPDYINRLYLVGSAELVNAWLQGDWDAIEGSFFPEFSTQLHVVQPRALPPHWTRIRAMDWGSAKPFSVGWYAVSDGSLPDFPRGALIKYREWYGVKKDQPNVGLKLSAEEVGRGIRLLERGQVFDDQKSSVHWPQVDTAREAERVDNAVIDPAAFAEDGGPSIASRLGVYFNRADNKRVAQSGAMGGWDQLRARLKGEGGKPMLYFFSTCVHTIRTLPAMQHDATRAEDMDSDGEDHAADETRYACMARPWVRGKPESRKPVDRYERDEEGSSWKVA
jgi:hypothetical protein